MTKEESAQWFSKTSNGYLVPNGDGQSLIFHDGFFEDMYQAFKARMIDELRTEEWKNALIR